MIKAKTGITEYFLMIKKTDEGKLKKRRDRDKRVLIVESV